MAYPTSDLPDNETIRARYASHHDWPASRYDRSAFDRVIGVHNGKGGVFKTSLVCNMAAILAATGNSRVLVIDTDPQGNCAINLGCTARSDDGAGLLFSLMNGPDQPPLRVVPVRDGLDLVPGGSLLAGLDLTHHEQPPANPYDLLVPGLSTVVDDYDVVFIDTPPGLSTVLLSALGVARWLLVPTQADRASILGLRDLVSRLGDAQEHNPDLDVLGAIVTDLPSNATRMMADAQAQLETMIGRDLVFSSGVRQAAAAAEACRARGVTAIELAELTEQIRPLDYLRRGEKPPNRAQSASGLAADYIALTDEFLQHLHDAENPDAENPDDDPTEESR